MIWQCSSTLQVGLGLLSVLSKSAVNLLVEMSVSVVDEVHILVCVVLASATVCAALILPVKTKSLQATKFLSSSVCRCFVLSLAV